MIDWNLQSRAHECQSCQRAFADKDAYHTLLFDEHAGYRRHDVCEACWQGQFSQGASDKRGFLSHWQGVYEAPPTDAPEAMKHETAETLLRKLMEQNEPRFEAARFILAVMLERKRILKVKDQLHQDGKRLFVYEHTANGDMLTITDPGLQLQQLDAVQREVAGLMAHGPNPAPAPAAPAPAEAVAAAPEAPVAAS